MINGILETGLNFIRTHSYHFQEYINYNYKHTNDNLLVIKKKYLKDCTYNVNNKLFFITECMESLDTIIDDYNFNDVKKTDIVVDIGANVGGFTILVSGLCKHIYAVEPLFDTELENNLKLNNVNNCIVLPFGLGDGFKKLEYKDKSKVVECFSLTNIKKKCGGKIDFLKMDCEGGEWLISSDELKDIRRIEMELHLFNGEKKEKFLTKLHEAGFDYKISSERKMTLMVHAINRSIS